MRRCVSVVLLLAGSLPAWAAPPKLEIPAEVRPSGQYCTFIPTTDAKAVVYVGLDAIDPVPSAVLKDARTFLLDTRGMPAGRYRFAAVGALGDEQTRTDFAVVLGTPPPGPTPPGPTPPPEPATPFERDLRTAWSAEAGPDKAKHRDLLAGLYRASAKDVPASTEPTAFGYFQKLRSARVSLIGEGLPAVRGVITTELDASLPTATDAPLDAAAKAACAKTFQRVADALGRLP